MGKTTLATNLAAALAENSRVMPLDADAQGSSQDWAESQGQRLFNLETRRAGDARGLVQEARKMAAEYDWVIIDGPAGTSRVSAEAVRAADLVLIPAKPSPYDVWAASDIVAAVKGRQATAHGVPKAAFIITMSRPRTLLGRQIEAALEEYGFPVLGSRTTERVAYPQMAIQGGRCWMAGTGPPVLRSSPCGTKSRGL